MLSIRPHRKASVLSTKYRLATAAVLSIGAIVAFGAPAAVATDAPIFTESFESCTEPSGDPTYGGIATAIHSADPIHVDLWASQMVDCPGWTAAGQAWMTEYASGAVFPDGSHAVWLNEGPTEGSISREITGLTAGRDYRVSLETWTDDQDTSTALALNVTNGSDVTNLTINLRAGAGIQALHKDFSALGDTVTIELVGSPNTPASPLIDNIQITDAGDTAENAAKQNHSDKKSSLAYTGVDVTGYVIAAGILFIGGIILLVLRRRSSRR